jgi:hypothetical protein
MGKSKKEKPIKCKDCMNARVRIKVHPKNFLWTILTPATNASSACLSGFSRVYCRKNEWVDIGGNIKEYKYVQSVLSDKFTQNKETCVWYDPDDIG